MAYEININNVTGDVVITASASLTDQLAISTDSDGNTYNSSDTPGYKAGYRLNSSGNEASASGVYVSGFIPVTFGQTVTFNNIQLDAVNQGTNYICVYDSSKALVLSRYSKLWATTNPTKNNVVLSDDSAYINSLQFNYALGSGVDISGMAYIRISANYIGSDSKIYVQ